MAISSNNVCIEAAIESEEDVISRQSCEETSIKRNGDGKSYKEKASEK